MERMFPTLKVLRLQSLHPLFQPSRIEAEFPSEVCSQLWVLRFPVQHLLCSEQVAGRLVCLLGPGCQDHGSERSLESRELPCLGRDLLRGIEEGLLVTRAFQIAGQGVVILRGDGVELV